MNIGQKVKVEITNFDRWAMGGAESMNGLTGTIEKMKDKDWFGNHEVLVNFDTPAKPWHSYQLPVTGFWFELKEVRAI